MSSANAVVPAPSPQLDSTVAEALEGLELVAPDAVPPGAIVLGVVIARPRAGYPARIRPLTAVRAECLPGLVVDRAGRRVLSHGEEIPLTRREFELFEFLAAHPGRVLTRDQLLDAVWEQRDPRYGPPRTVDVHIARLRRKLGPEHAAALQSLRGVGYRWTGSPS